MPIPELNPEYRRTLRVAYATRKAEFISGYETYRSAGKEGIISHADAVHVGDLVRKGKAAMNLLVKSMSSMPQDRFSEERTGLQSRIDELEAILMQPGIKVMPDEQKPNNDIDIDLSSLQK